MTTNEGHCCGNCDAFMPDPLNWGEQGACAVITEENIKFGTYTWTTEDGDCSGWKPRKRRASRSDPGRSARFERALYERRMKGDWS